MEDFLPSYVNDVMKHHPDALSFRILGIAVPPFVWTLYFLAISFLNFLDVLTDSNYAATVSWGGA